MMTLGFQGPTIGRVLQECLDAVLDEHIPNEHEALMAFAKDRQLKSEYQNGNTKQVLPFWYAQELRWVVGFCRWSYNE